MTKDFSFKKQSSEGFQEFLKSEQLSFINFFLIYTGALLTCSLLGSYLGAIRFSPFFSIGNLLLVWAGWLILSFLLSKQERFRRIILWTNNLFLAFLFFSLAIFSPGEWVVVLLSYFIFALLLINFTQGSFFPVIDSLSLGFLSAIGLVYFYVDQALFFQGNASAQLIFLFWMILSFSGSAFFVWNGLRTQNSLQKIYNQRRELEETAAVLEVRIKAKTQELREQAELLREENRLKTEALRSRIDELERFRRMVVGREMKMIELKEKLAQKKKELAELKGKKK